MVKVKKLHRVIKIIRPYFKPKSLQATFFALLILLSSGTQAKFGSIVDIGLAGDLYLTNESANNGQGFVNLLIQNTWDNSEILIDVGAGGLVGDTATSFVKAPQVLFRYGIKDRYYFTIGRFKHQWSFLDDFWNMGLTQPVFTWNEASPEQQGLMGAYWRAPIVHGLLDLNLFGSLVFIPSQGPSFDLTDGSITSSNPWFSEPVEILNLGGTKADLNFAVNVPNTTDIIARDKVSVGAQVTTPLNRRGLLFNSFFMSKPRNDLILPFEGALNATTFNGDITVNPQVGKHTIYGVDFGWHSRRFKTIFSWVYESDVNFSVPSNTTYPIIPEQNIFSVQQLIRLTRTQRIWFGYINVDREANQVGGTFANAQISTFIYRNRFEEAVRVKWEGLLFKRQNRYRVKTNVTYTQNLQQDNGWLSVDLKWSAYRGFEMFSRCDFFGGSEKVIKNTDFISRNQNNDRCLIGGHYAF